MAQSKEKPTTNQLSMMLIEKRHALKLTQKDVADQLGISQSLYSKIERGEGTLNLRLLTKISQFLDTTLKVVFDIYVNK